VFELFDASHGISLCDISTPPFNLFLIVLDLDVHRLHDALTDSESDEYTTGRNTCETNDALHGGLGDKVHVVYELQRNANF